ESPTDNWKTLNTDPNDPSESTMALSDPEYEKLKDPFYGYDLEHRRHLRRESFDPTKIIIGNHLTPQQHEIAMSVLTHYADVFAWDMSQLGRTRAVEHKIVTVPHKPIFMKPYKCSISERVDH